MLFSQEPIKMKYALLMDLTTNQSNSSSPTRCILIYLCGKMNRGRARGRLVEVRTRRTQQPPPVPPAPHRSTHPPTAWSAPPHAGAQTRSSLAVPPSWHLSPLASTCERYVRVLLMRNQSYVKRRKNERACFSVPLASAAAPAPPVAAHAKMRLAQDPWTYSPCHRFLSATPPSASCSQILRGLGVT